jgi:hypothetical protein
MMPKLIHKVFLCLLCTVFFLAASGVPGHGAAAKEKNLPIGEMLWRGDVTIEVRENRWIRVEGMPFPIFKGMKIKTGNGTAAISLSNHCQVELGPNSLVSFPGLDEVTLAKGEINFRIPTTGRTQLSVGALAVMRSPSLQASKSSAPVYQKMEESVGTAMLSPGGSLTVKTERGKLFVLDQDRNVVASISSKESVRIPSTQVWGKERVMLAQAGGPPPAVKKVQDEVASQSGHHAKELDDLEGYLIDFSKALKGKEIPPDLDRDKFFNLLEKHYPRREIIDAVKKYELKTQNRDESYVVTICDRQRQWCLYKDYGETIDYVEYPYWPEGIQVECTNPALRAAAVGWVQLYAVGVAAIILSDDDDDVVIDKKPICP